MTEIYLRDTIMSVGEGVGGELKGEERTVEEDGITLSDVMKEEESGEGTALRTTLARSMVSDARGLREVLAASGVTLEGYFDILEEGNGEFAARVARLADLYSKAYEPFVWKALISEVTDGNVQAMKLFFEVRSKRGGSGGYAEDGGADYLPTAEISGLRREIFGE